MLRLTILISAVASATFAATLAFAPAVLNVGQRLSLGQSEIVREISPPVVVQQNRECSPLEKIAAALKRSACVP